MAWLRQCVAQSLLSSEGEAEEDAAASCAASCAAACSRLTAVRLLTRCQAVSTAYADEGRRPLHCMKGAGAPNCWLQKLQELCSTRWRSGRQATIPCASSTSPTTAAPGGGLGTSRPHSRSCTRALRPCAPARRTRGQRARSHLWLTARSRTALREALAQLQGGPRLGRLHDARPAGHGTEGHHRLSSWCLMRGRQLTDLGLGPVCSIGCPHVQEPQGVTDPGGQLPRLVPWHLSRVPAGQQLPDRRATQTLTHAGRAPQQQLHRARCRVLNAGSLHAAHPRLVSTMGVQPLHPARPARTINWEDR